MNQVKIALINDTHFGARGDSQLFFNYFIKFFDEVFFPYIKEHNITTVIHAGDLMDRRKYVNFNILHQVRREFIDKFREEDIELHCILGNHDIYYRNTNTVNSIRELFGHDLKLYEKPTVINFDGLDIALLPWVNKENIDESLKFIRNVAAPILIGHLELQGYDVIRGVKYHLGMKADLFNRFERVYTGHFHCKQSRGNIDYLGTQYQITFADLEEPKGFHVLDTETRDIEYIENPNKMFHKLVYNDSDDSFKIKDIDFSIYKDTYVKLFIESKNQPVKYNNFMDLLEGSGVAKITIVEDVDNSDWTKEEIVDLTQDTVTIINNEIDEMKEIEDKSKMKRIIKDLYMESLAI